MYMNRALAAFVVILTFIGTAEAQSEQFKWSVDPAFEFSIRCSAPPHRVEFGGLSGTFIKQIYLKVADGQLSLLRYSTSVGIPHRWINSESPVVYRSPKNHGKSKIESKRTFRKVDNDTISRIEVSLDASAAQDSLDLYISDFVTYGKWSIFKQPGMLTFNESTSLFVDGKLSQSSSTSWDACHLMTKDGEDVRF